MKIKNVSYDVLMFLHWHHRKNLQHSLATPAGPAVRRQTASAHWSIARICYGIQPQRRGCASYLIFSPHPSQSWRDTCWGFPATAAVDKYRKRQKTTTTYYKNHISYANKILRSSYPWVLSTTQQGVGHYGGSDQGRGVGQKAREHQAQLREILTKKMNIYKKRTEYSNVCMLTLAYTGALSPSSTWGIHSTKNPTKSITWVDCKTKSVLYFIRLKILHILPAGI